MENVKFILIQFFIAFILVYLLEYIILVRKNKELDSTKKLPTEVEYIVRVYKINLSKIDYYKLIKTLSFTNTFIIVLVFTVVSNIIVGTIWQLLIGFALLCILILVIYGLIGRRYKEMSDKNV